MQSIPHLIMGHLSIDCSLHVHFPLMLHYQSSIYLLVERWYDNYHDEAELAAMSDALLCNMRGTPRSVLWPWWLSTPEMREDEKLSWELVMTRSDMFDLIDLQAHKHTHTHPHTHTYRCTHTHMYKHGGWRERKRQRRNTQQQQIWKQLATPMTLCVFFPENAKTNDDCLLLVGINKETLNG